MYTVHALWFWILKWKYALIHSRLWSIYSVFSFLSCCFLISGVFSPTIFKALVRIHLTNWKWRKSGVLSQTSSTGIIAVWAIQMRMKMFVTSQIKNYSSVKQKLSDKLFTQFFRGFYCVFAPLLMEVFSVWNKESLRKLSVCNGKTNCLFLCLCMGYEQNNWKSK